jgi:hypothetical protein
MSYNGSGTFQINTSGQPVVTGTVISSSAFNALTADLATGLSTAITKDGQTATTVRIPFAQGINSSLTTDTSSGSTGSIYTAGGVGITKGLFVGGTATFSATPIFSALTASSAVATDASKNLVSVTNTGTGNNVLATSPTLVTPALGTPSSGVMTNVTGINYDGFKNRIINGAMVIDQRNAGASVSIQTSTGYILDRWNSIASVNSKFSIQQNAGSITPPVGFSSYMGLTSSATTSLNAGDYYGVRQFIEGFNVNDLAWGTANAATVTLSFRVYSSLTGTFGGVIYNAAFNRSYPFTYTISSANTWTSISITIAGDTTGTWVTNNLIGIAINFSIGTGSTYSGTANSWSANSYLSATGATSVVGTNGATFYITGVQLEKGSTATSFDVRSYGTELGLCQRYYYSSDKEQAYSALGTGWEQSTTAGTIYCPLPIPMRVTPTSVSYSTLQLNDSGGSNLAVSSLTLDTSECSRIMAKITVTVSLAVVGRVASLRSANSTSGFIAFSAEL